MQSTLQAQISAALRTVFGKDVLCAYVIDPELAKRQRADSPAPTPRSPRLLSPSASSPPRSIRRMRPKPRSESSPRTRSDLPRRTLRGSQALSGS
ncbi:hypothetical protein [Nesterenkonia pannonica]|uniref:hypothetical protein n=1 Tax=Nesterenkonia pannonica TaxID=1548602 RepID=UPI0021649776|nr:hypothetical protein [Nesterenkonia pannonica]